MVSSHLTGESDPSLEPAKGEISFQRVSPETAANKLGYNTAYQYLSQSAYRSHSVHPCISGGQIVANEAGTIIESAEQSMSAIANHRTLNRDNSHYLQGLFSSPSVMISAPEALFPTSSDVRLMRGSESIGPAECSDLVVSPEHTIPAISRVQGTTRSTSSLLPHEAPLMLDLYHGVRRQATAPIDHTLSQWQPYDWYENGLTKQPDLWDDQVGLDDTHLVGGPAIILKYDDNGNYNTQMKVLSNSVPTSGYGMQGVRPRTIAPVRPTNTTWIAEWDGSDLRNDDHNTHPVPPTFVWGSVLTDVGISHSSTVPGHPGHALPESAFVRGPVGIKMEAYLPPPTSSTNYINYLAGLEEVFGNSLNAGSMGNWDVSDNGEEKWTQFTAASNMQIEDQLLPGSYPTDSGCFGNWRTFPNYRYGPGPVQRSRSRAASSGIIRNWRAYCMSAVHNGSTLVGTHFDTCFENLTSEPGSSDPCNDLSTAHEKRLTAHIAQMTALNYCKEDTDNVWTVQWNFHAGRGSTFGPPNQQNVEMACNQSHFTNTSGYGLTFDHPSGQLVITISKCVHSDREDLDMWAPAETQLPLRDMPVNSRGLFTATPDFGTNNVNRNTWLPRLLSDVEDFGFWKIAKKAGAFTNYLVGWYLHPDDNEDDDADKTMTDLICGYDLQDTLWRKLKTKEYWNNGTFTFNGSHAMEDMSIAAFLVTPIRTVSGFTNQLFKKHDAFEFTYGNSGEPGYWNWDGGGTVAPYPPFHLYDYCIHKDRDFTSTTEDVNWLAPGSGTLHERSENRYLANFQSSPSSHTTFTDAMRYETVIDTVNHDERIRQYVQYGQGPTNYSWVEPGQNLAVVDDISGRLLPISSITSMDSMSVSSIFWIFARRAGSVGTDDGTINALFKGKIFHLKSFESWNANDAFTYALAEATDEDKVEHIYNPFPMTWKALSESDKVFDHNLETRGQAFNRVIEQSIIRKPPSVMEAESGFLIKEGANSTAGLDLQWVRDMFNQSFFDGIINRINSSSINFPQYEGWGDSLYEALENMLDKVYKSIAWIVVTILDGFDDIFGYLISRITQAIEYGFNDKLMPWLDQKVAVFIDELGKGKNWMLMLMRLPIPMVPGIQALLPTFWVSFGSPDHPEKDAWNATIYTGGRDRFDDIALVYPKGKAKEYLQLWTYGATSDFYNTDERKRPIMVADLSKIWDYIATLGGNIGSGHVTPFSKIKVTEGMQIPSGMSEGLPTRIWLSVPQWMRPVNLDESKIAIPGSEDWEYEDGFARDEQYTPEGGSPTYQYADYVHLMLDIIFYIFVIAIVGALAYVIRSPRAIIPILSAIIGRGSAIYGAVMTKGFRSETKSQLNLISEMMKDMEKLSEDDLTASAYSQATYKLLKNHLSSALEALGAVARALRGKTRGSDLRLLTELTKLSSPTSAELRDALESIEDES